MENLKKLNLTFVWGCMILGLIEPAALNIALILMIIISLNLCYIIYKQIEIK